MDMFMSGCDTLITQEVSIVTDTLVNYGVTPFAETPIFDEMLVRGWCKCRLSPAEHVGLQFHSYSDGLAGV